MIREHFQVVILAGGKSKGMRSRHPDVIQKVLSQPLIQWAVELGEELEPDRLIISCCEDDADDIRGAIDSSRLEMPLDFLLGEIDPRWAAVLDGVVDYCRTESGYTLFLPANAPNMDSQILSTFVEMVIGSPQPLGIITAEPDKNFDQNRLVTRDRNLNITGLAKKGRYGPAKRHRNTYHRTEQKRLEVDTGFYLAPNHFLIEVYEKMVEPPSNNTGSTRFFRWRFKNLVFWDGILTIPGTAIP